MTSQPLRKTMMNHDELDKEVQGIKAVVNRMLPAYPYVDEMRTVRTLYGR